MLPDETRSMMSRSDSRHGQDSSDRMRLARYLALLIANKQAYLSALAGYGADIIVSLCRYLPRVSIRGSGQSRCGEGGATSVFLQ